MKLWNWLFPPSKKMTLLNVDTDITNRFEMTVLHEIKQSLEPKMIWEFDWMGITHGTLKTFHFGMHVKCEIGKFLSDPKYFVSSNSLRVDGEKYESFRLNYEIGQIITDHYNNLLLRKHKKEMMELDHKNNKVIKKYI